MSPGQDYGVFILKLSTLGKTQYTVGMKQVFMNLEQMGRNSILQFQALLTEPSNKRPLGRKVLQMEAERNVETTDYSIIPNNPKIVVKSLFCG